MINKRIQQQGKGHLNRIHKKNSIDKVIDDNVHPWPSDERNVGSGNEKTEETGKIPNDLQSLVMPEVLLMRLMLLK